jgi:hypothetical protein
MLASQGDYGWFETSRNFLNRISILITWHFEELVGVVNIVIKRQFITKIIQLIRQFGDVTLVKSLGHLLQMEHCISVPEKNWVGLCGF